MSPKEFRIHLIDIHGLDMEKDLHGTKQMVFHADGEKWFASTYQWTLDNGLTFKEFYEGKRKSMY